MRRSRSASFTEVSAIVEAGMEGGNANIQEQESVRQLSQDDLHDQEDQDRPVPNQPSIDHLSPQEVTEIILAVYQEVSKERLIIL